MKKIFNFTIQNITKIYFILMGGWTVIASIFSWNINFDDVEDGVTPTYALLIGIGYVVIALFVAPFCEYVLDRIMHRISKFYPVKLMKDNLPVVGKPVYFLNHKYELESYIVSSFVYTEYYDGALIKIYSNSNEVYRSTFNDKPFFLSENDAQTYLNEQLLKKIK